jgi:E1A/CREB-binding protein
MVECTTYCLFEEWYKKLLDKGIMNKIVVDYKDIQMQAKSDNLSSLMELQYFDGDYWPEVIEDCIRNDTESRSIDEKLSKSNKDKRKLGATEMLLEHLNNSKNMYFAIRLMSKQMEMNNMEIVDSDALITSELMDNRDVFMARSIEEHWEFSTLRHAKYSTMCICYEPHNSIDKLDVIKCDESGKSRAIWHCSTCYVCCIL